MFRATNPIQTPARKLRMDWKETVAQITAGLLLGALGVIAVNIATDGPSDAVNPPVAVTNPTQDNTACEDNLKAWTRDAQQMIDEMDSRWSSSAPYSASVRTDNIDPMTSRLDYIVNEVCK